MIKLRSVGITGVGAYAPENVLTNFDLEKMVDTSDEWIRTRTGISERRRASEEQATSDIALEGAKIAMQKAGVKPEEIDLIVLSSVTPDMVMPATACFVQEKLGCKNAAAFDLAAGCSGFVYGLSVGSQFVATGAFDKVLVIGCDLLTKFVDWTDRNTCVLFGDGGGAAVLEPVEEGLGILGHIIKADGSGTSFIEMPGGGTRYPASHRTIDEKMHFIKMKGPEVFKFAVKVFADTVLELSEKVGVKPEEIDLIVPHQANNRILESAAKKLNMSMDKLYSNLEWYGNTSGGSIPIALAEALDKGRIKKGDNIFLIAFGAGLTWGGVALKWAYDPKN